MVHIRPMEPTDVVASEQVWHEAVVDLQRRSQLPELEVTTTVAERKRARIAHLLATDPSGSYVADDNGDVVAVAQALVREELWVLSLFGVSTRAQNRGIGRQLLEPALAYRSDLPGMILCSRDPRAMRRYAMAGFSLQPAITARGRVRHDALPRTDAVRCGGTSALELAAEVDRRVRGASHGPDFGQLLEGGGTLLWHDAGGYVIARDGRPLLLAAEEEATATELFFAALADAPASGEIEVKWITADQQWAITASLGAGLELHPTGPVMIRDLGSVPHPYLPTGEFG
jgi:GNAT superfamily N-acetyltransferase